MEPTMSDSPRRGMIMVTFIAEIKLTPEEVAHAEGSLAQAIQNEIGHTGAVVMEIEDLWEIQ